jgi:hypothetical protein
MWPCPCVSTTVDILPSSVNVLASVLQRNRQIEEIEKDNER